MKVGRQATTTVAQASSTEVRQLQRQGAIAST